MATRVRYLIMWQAIAIGVGKQRKAKVVIMKHMLSFQTE